MKLYSINFGDFKLDGGAMFGVVPKVIWEKTNPPDSKNRVSIATRSLLIEDKNKLILIDTGLGNKQSEKFFSHYDLSGTHNIAISLKKYGFCPDDITDVFFTHLHFDHCGGAIHRNNKGFLEPYFKNATFWVHKNQWEWAVKPNKREVASFLPENIKPIEESGQLKLITDTQKEIKTTLSFSALLVDGHTEKQMLPIVKYKKKTIVFAGDLIPTTGHLPIPYVMGYDTRPLLTLTEKENFLTWAYKNEILLFLEHDVKNELISLRNTEKGIRMKESFTLKEFF